jgi:hypothetical protein
LIVEARFVVRCFRPSQCGKPVGSVAGLLMINRSPRIMVFGQSRRHWKRTTSHSRCSDLNILADCRVMLLYSVALSEHRGVRCHLMASLSRENLFGAHVLRPSGKRLRRSLPLARTLKAAFVEHIASDSHGSFRGRIYPEDDNILPYSGFADVQLQYPYRNGRADPLLHSVALNATTLPDSARVKSGISMVTNLYPASIWS